MSDKDLEQRFKEVRLMILMVLIVLLGQAIGYFGYLFR